MPGFLLGDISGLDKTLSVWSAIVAMPEADVLILHPKSGLPQWWRTIALAGSAGEPPLSELLRPAESCVPATSR